jgi:hypothetical protein
VVNKKIYHLNTNSVRGAYLSKSLPVSRTIASALMFFLFTILRVLIARAPNSLRRRS